MLSMGPVKGEICPHSALWPVLVASGEDAYPQPPAAWAPTPGLSEGCSGLPRSVYWGGLIPLDCILPPKLYPSQFCA